MALKKPRVLHLDPKAAEGDKHWKPQNPPIQWHSSPNKATHTPIRPHVLIVPLCMVKHPSRWIYGGLAYSNYHTHPGRPVNRWWYFFFKSCLGKDIVEIFLGNAPLSNIKDYLEADNHPFPAQVFCLFQSFHTLFCDSSWALGVRVVFSIYQRGLGTPRSVLYILTSCGFPRCCKKKLLWRGEG